MKRLSLLFAILFVMVSTLSAQQVVKQRIGHYTENGETVVAEATTTLAVDVTVRYEEFVSGPYAQYAKKLLGSRALQVSYMEYSIVGAEVAVAEDDSYMVDKTTNDEIVSLPLNISFPEVLPDKMSMQTMTLEQAAKQAADTILELRRVRLDLISGEYGDGVYGAGLESALREIDRIEKSYLELFFGKSEERIFTKRIYMPVDANRKSQVVARFNAEQGLLSSDDLSGDIIMVAINPSAMEYPASSIKGKATYRYANNATVIVTLGQQLLTSRVLPIFEFGETVTF